MVVLMPLFAAALVVRRRYFIVSPRPFTAAPLVVRRRCLIVVPMPMPEAPRMYFAVARGATRCALHIHGRSAMTDACGRRFAVLSTQVSSDDLRLRLLVPRPMPAAVASRCCRRRFQQMACA
jgi:hypothetical protein